MLQAIKEGNEAANKERKRRGISPLHILGWEQPPRYNETTHNLNGPRAPKATAASA
jgi:uncharacterized membrane-anchored protein